MIIQKKNIGLYVLLSILTCGLFSLYWMYSLHEDTNKFSSAQGEMEPVIVVILNIITCGIYGAYWCFRQGEKLQQIYAERGVPCGDNLAILYLLLNICNYFTGFTTVIAYALMQDKINVLIDAGHSNEGYADRNVCEEVQKSKSTHDAPVVEVEIVEEETASDAVETDEQ